MSEQVPEGAEEEIAEPDIKVQTGHSDRDAVAEHTSQKESKEQKFIGIDLPFTDEEGVEQTRRITVPILREKKERKYRIIKRKRMVLPENAEEETEEEYDTCMLVETVTRTVLIRDVTESGDVEEREEDFVEEYFIGKERKFRYVTIEKTDEDGTTHEVEELEVESEEEEKPRKMKKIRKRIVKKLYDSNDELIGEEYECEWMDKEEGSVREELSYLKEVQEDKEIRSEEEELKWEEEMMVIEDEEMKAMEELLEEVEEEPGIEEETEKEEIPSETSFEREQKKQKASYNKLSKLYSKELKRRKVLMKDLKLFCCLTGVQIQSPGKEFDENPQKFIDYEISELKALTKHVIEVYDEYKMEEDASQKEIDESNRITKELLDNYKQALLEEIHNSDPKVMERLTKGKDLTKKVDDIFKYEELMAKRKFKKLMGTVNTELMKHFHSTEVDQSEFPEEEKEMDPVQLEKMMQELKLYQNEALYERMELEKEQKKFRQKLENVTCKRREEDFVARKKEESVEKDALIVKKIGERMETCCVLDKYFRDRKKEVKKLKMTKDFKTRFPAIYHHQKKMEAQGICSKELLKSLKKHCPEIMSKMKKVSMPEEGSE